MSETVIGVIAIAIVVVGFLIMARGRDAFSGSTSSAGSFSPTRDVARGAWQAVLWIVGGVFAFGARRKHRALVERHGRQVGKGGTPKNH